LAISKSKVLSGSGGAEFNASLDLVESFSGSALFPVEFEGKAVVLGVIAGLGKSEVGDIL
jgi:hypothetical protein